MSKNLALLLSTVPLFSGVALASSHVSAEDTSVVDQINITVPVSCTMSGTGMQSHNAEIANGTYTPDIGSTTLHAFCNDNEGFAIYAAGYTGNEVGGTNSNKLVGTTASGNATIESGVATGPVGSNDISNWAMKLTMTQDSGDTTTDNAFTIDSAPNEALPSQAESGATQAPFSAYHVVPNEYTKVAHKNSMTDMTETTGGVKLTTTYAAYISKTQPADTYSGQVIYTLVHPSTAPAPGPKSLDTATTMQEVTFCSDKLPGGQVYTLTDSRDGNAYHVARLKDGNCWMLDNLALDPTDLTTASNMNESNTNATAAAIDNLLHGGSATTGWSSVAVSGIINGGFLPNSEESLANPLVYSKQKNLLAVGYGPISTNGQAKVGIYYNFCAASASTYCYASGTGVDVSDTIIDTPQDICPVNWRLPSGGDGGEYDGLSQQYMFTQDATDNRSLQYALSTTLAGHFSIYGIEDIDYLGSWWSSTMSSNHDIYSLNVTSNRVYMDSYDRSDLSSVRCMLGE